MVKIERFNNFNCEIDFQKIANSIPDSDIPNEIIQMFELCDKMVYVEGWCDRCFSNYGVEEDDIDSKIEIAKDLTFKRLKEQPLLPQNKRLFGYELVDWDFIELPDNVLNYAVSIGIYKKIKDTES